MAVLVEAQVAEPQDVTGELAARAPKHGLHPGDHLGQAERLGHVVVTAGAKGVDLVLHCVPRREEEDGGLEPAFA